MIVKISQAPAPTTKKQLCSFLGLVGYFVPNFAAIAVPFTDLTKKGSPNQLQWEAVHEQACVRKLESTNTSRFAKIPFWNPRFPLYYGKPNFQGGSTFSTSQILVPLGKDFRIGTTTLVPSSWTYCNHK